MLGALVIFFALTSVASAQRPDPEGARQVLALVNAERQRAGAPVLEWDDKAAEAAMRHAQEMVKYGTASHQFPGEPKLRDRLTATGLKFNDDGENVAYDSTLEEAHQRLMESSGHRANILNPRFDAAGIAVIWQGVRVYVVENFVRRIPDISDSETAARIVEAFNRARRAAGMRPVEAKPDLRDAACSMAKKDRVSANAAGDMKARVIVAFTTFQPEELPKALESRLAENYSRIAIGACFARTPTYPSGTNWVVMVFYP